MISMKKRIFFITILLIASSRVQAAPILENSIWGSAAAYAGINVATLYGIAVQESGMKWQDGTFRPWPWTINVNKTSKGVKAGARRYANKSAAEQGLKRFLALGIRNIDVGIMQVNLYWHGDKVPNDLALLDPKTNINVAARYLRDINKQNITKTVSDYHAPTNPEHGKNYVNLVKRYEKIIHEKIN